MATNEIERAMVTGASTGLGKEFATQLATRGANLVLVARNGERLDALAAELRASAGVDVEVLVADLRDRAALAAVETRVAAAPPVDLLVNNAGYLETGDFADLDIEASQGQIDLNVTALVRLAHAAVRAGRSRGRGGVINLASGAAFVPSPGTAIYSATKAFVVAFSQALREEAKADGVTVTVVCPGFTRTEFQDRAHFDTSAYPDFVWQSAEQVVTETLAAHDAERGLLIPGVQNRVLAGVMQLVPRSWLGPMVARLTAEQPPRAE